MTVFRILAVSSVMSNQGLRIAVVAAVISLILLVTAVDRYGGGLNQLKSLVSEDVPAAGPHRKLLHLYEPTRIWGGTKKCSESDLVVSQGPTSPLPSGIPTYTVLISNACASGCEISEIHLNCGWFSSARLINPRIFKRLRFNDCLVNGGKPLKNGATISFQYANTFSYPLSVSSMQCL
ncbi:hypothetical protein Nepgr_033337 [Nepenthes gracilis]|uniref:Uncharacterized protein n=1 Tax=Nepenthes gracilis TaxID=150966 RepID=A0AAD3TLQ2_NEPGR|nr:hypothetical protein Nepgr_033337 [Nepenthes gracilis]